MCEPLSRSATRRSWIFCRCSPNSALVPKKVSRTKSCITGDPAPPIEDMRDSISRYPKLACQLRGAHFQCLELLGEMLAGMNCMARVGFPLVIIDHFNIHRTVCALWPFKANSPLVVYSNTVLSRPVAL